MAASLRDSEAPIERRVCRLVILPREILYRLNLRLFCAASGVALQSAQAGTARLSQISEDAVGLLSALVLLHEVDEGGELDVVDVRAGVGLSQVQPQLSWGAVVERRTAERAL